MCCTFVVAPEATCGDGWGCVLWCVEDGVVEVNVDGGVVGGCTIG